MAHLRTERERGQALRVKRSVMLGTTLKRMFSFARVGTTVIRPDAFAVPERFCACDGSCLVEFLADSEEDAREVCKELGWLYLSHCD